MANQRDHKRDKRDNKADSIRSAYLRRLDGVSTSLGCHVDLLHFFWLRGLTVYLTSANSLDTMASSQSN